MGIIAGLLFFNWAPVQLDDIDLEPSVDHVFRYRMHVHEGKLKGERTEQLWHDFADPPRVRAESVHARPGRPGSRSGTMAA